MIELSLGGRQFAVAELAIGPKRRWRELVRPHIDTISELVLASQVDAPTPERMARLVFTSGLLIDYDPLLAAVLAYSPELQAEAEWINDHALELDVLLAVYSLFFISASPSMPNGSAPPPAATISTS